LQRKYITSWLPSVCFAYYRLKSLLNYCYQHNSDTGSSHGIPTTHEETEIFIIIMMSVKGYVRSLFLSPQSGVGTSISSSVIQCSLFLLVCISVPVLAVYFCPSSVHVVATFSGTILFPLLYSVLPFFP